MRLGCRVSPDVGGRLSSQRKTRMEDTGVICVVDHLGASAREWVSWCRRISQQSPISKKDAYGKHRCHV